MDPGGNGDVSMIGVGGEDPGDVIAVKHDIDQYAQGKAEVYPEIPVAALPLGPKTALSGEESPATVPLESSGVEEKGKKTSSSQRQNVTPVVFEHRIPGCLERCINAEPSSSERSRTFVDCEGTRWNLYIFFNHGTEPPLSRRVHNRLSISNPNRTVPFHGNLEEGHRPAKRAKLWNDKPDMLKRYGLRKSDVQNRYLSIFLELAELKEGDSKLAEVPSFSKAKKMIRRHKKKKRLKSDRDDSEEELGVQFNSKGTMYVQNACRKALYSLSIKDAEAADPVVDLTASSSAEGNMVSATASKESILGPYELSNACLLNCKSEEDGADQFKRDDDHEFHAGSTDWGYQKFISLSELPNNSQSGDVIVRVVLCPAPPHVRKVPREELGSTGTAPAYYNLPDYDSKTTTGMVGLNNQGATCYMNSLLQTLFHTRVLRQAIYDMPTETETHDTLGGQNAVRLSVPLALQRTFWRMQVSTKAVNTEELTRSFGWESQDAFQQHDVQELSRVLLDNLEEKMKGTRSEGLISKLLQGSTMNYIKCVNVDYNSSRTEEFFDVQLDVKGCCNIHESFKKYVAEEMLEGDNQYDAGTTYGKQDAKKGVLFTSMPPILHLQLKRFEYNFQTDRMWKINDRYEFPLSLNLTKFGAARDGKTLKRKYLLHSILIHTGDVFGGHYYCFVRLPPKSPCAEKVGAKVAGSGEESNEGSDDDTDSDCSDDGNAPPKNNCDIHGWRWYKFDDEIVTPIEPNEAMEDAYGGSWGDNLGKPFVGFNEGDDPIFEDEDEKNDLKAVWGNDYNINSRPRLSNAYMLVYINADECESIMKDITENDIPEHLSERFRQEDAKAKRGMAYKNEESEHFRIRVVDEETVRNVDGSMITYEHDFVPTGTGFTNFDPTAQSYVLDKNPNLYATAKCPKGDRVEKMLRTGTLGKLFSVR
eukprot:g2515.t1